MSFLLSRARAWRSAVVVLALGAVSERAWATCGFDVTSDFGQHDATFQQCLDTTCCTQSSACYADPLCRERFTCVETKCAPNDVACENVCAQQYPANGTDFGALWNCTMKCPASGSSGGAAGHAGTTGSGASGGSGATSSGGSGATSGGFGATSSGGKSAFGSGGSAPNPFGSRAMGGTSSDVEGAGGAADPGMVAFCATSGPGNARGGGLAWTAIALALVASRGRRAGAAR